MTRIYVHDVHDIDRVAVIHGEVFRDIRPATTIVRVDSSTTGSWSRSKPRPSTAARTNSRRKGGPEEVKKINVVVTGATGQVAYALLPRIAAGRCSAPTRKSTFVFPTSRR
jgi:hypothetical protein